MSDRILCMECGKSVSTPVPTDTIVRAYVKCPECIEAQDVPRERHLARLREEHNLLKEENARFVRVNLRLIQEQAEDRAAIQDVPRFNQWLHSMPDVVLAMDVWRQKHAPAIARATEEGK